MDQVDLIEGRTFWEMVERRAAATPDTPMMIDASGRTMTYGEFRGEAERVAAGLAARGIVEGDTVAWQLPTRISTVVLAMALSRLGTVQNPILHVYREREVRFALQQLRPKLFVHPGEFRGFDFGHMTDGIVAELEAPPEILVVPSDETLPTADPSSLPPPPTTEGDAPIRWIYFTSGTTSDPKGVKHTDGTLIAGGMGLAHAAKLKATDVGSMAFPFTHIAGPDYLCTMLATGFPAVLVEAFVPDEAVELYRRMGVTMAGGSTAFYTMFLNEQRKAPDTPLIPSLRLLSGGGAPKPPEIYFEVKREMGIPIVHGYGMTEVPMITMGTPDDSDDQLAHTDGRPVVGADVRIVQLDGTPAPAGVDGEVRVRGPMVCKGYTDPALDADAFDADGYFRTGDLGHVNPDGHIALTGRVKDIIIRKGENISAKEIEDVLYTHPKVGDVAVVGLRDRERGELVCAVVEPAPGQAGLTFDEMTDHCRAAGLMVQKIPERLEVLDRLPRNETLNKVLKQKLRDQFSH